MFPSAVVSIFISVIYTSMSQELGKYYNDVTTLVKIKETSPIGTVQYESPIVVVRGHARGLPLRKNLQSFNTTYAGRPCCHSWTHEGWTKLDITTTIELNPPLNSHIQTSYEQPPPPEADRFDRLGTVFSRTAENYTEDSYNGNLPVDGRIRLSFRLSSPENSTVSLFLCEGEELPTTECVVFILSGYESRASFLQYEAFHLGNNGTGRTISTPFGTELKSTLLHRNESAPLSWGANITYNFLVEHSYEGNFEIRLDGADFQQKRLMTIKATTQMTKFAVASRISLHVKADRTWHGYLRPGGWIWVDYRPSENHSGELGVFMCADRFQEDCIGEIVSGVSADGIRYFVGNFSQNEISDTKYWVAGTEEKTYRRTEISRSENVQSRWSVLEGDHIEDKNKHRFYFSRYSNGSVRVKHIGFGHINILNIPKEYIHIFIASYQHTGEVWAKAADENCLSTGTCIAPASVWVLRAATGELRSPSLPASVAKTLVCVTIVTRVSPRCRVTVAMQHTGGLGRLQMGTLSVSPEDKTQWLIRRFVRATPRALRDKPLNIVVSVTQPTGNPDPVMVQWVASCNANGDQDVYFDKLDDESPYYFGPSVMVRQLYWQYSPVCMNGGHLEVGANTCLCAPGFTGDVCDQGCGPDSFGADCGGKCSSFIFSRQCSGLKLCGSWHNCDCAPGFGGPRCTEKCEPGRYGIGCQESCGKCREGVACNPYTGYCEDGCRGALQPPYCKEECGRSTPVVSYIINGEDATAEDFPWHAGVYDTKYRGKMNPTGSETTEQICGATLIKAKLLISAAHCFYSENEEKLQPAERYKVALGKTFRGWDDPNERPADRVQRRDVYWIHIPTRYRGDIGAFADDIALLELLEPVETTIYVAPICLDWAGGYEAVLDSTMNGSAVGWGRTENGDSSRQLKTASLLYIGSEHCLDQITDRSFVRYINKDKFCAGNENGASVSTGDSGGGLVFKNHDHEGAWFLRGIVSVGPRAERTFAVYTNVSSYRTWLSNIKNNVNLRDVLISRIATQG